jgi:hypothetical protein
MVKRRDTVGLEPTGLILMGVQIPLPAPRASGGIGRHRRLKPSRESIEVRVL